MTVARSARIDPARPCALDPELVMDSTLTRTGTGPPEYRGTLSHRPEPPEHFPTGPDSQTTKNKCHHSAPTRLAGRRPAPTPFSTTTPHDPSSLDARLTKATLRHSARSANHTHPDLTRPCRSTRNRPLQRRRCRSNRLIQIGLTELSPRPAHATPHPTLSTPTPTTHPRERNQTLAGASIQTRGEGHTHPLFARLPSAESGHRRTHASI